MSPAAPTTPPAAHAASYRATRSVRAARAAALAASLLTILPLLVLAAALVPTPAIAQRPTLSRSVLQYVAVDTPVVALTHVRVIDGTGAPARENQTLIIRDGRIAALGDAASTSVPAGAQVMDLTGKSVIPGLVMMHEHLFYPTGPSVYGNLAESFTRLYLAGGVTSMRTGGNVSGYGEINIANAIKRGERPGPWIDATAPYLQGPGLGIWQMYELKNADDARRMVDFWADAGATSFKAYMNITRAELRAAVQEAHKRGLKITGHLCSVTYHEAAAAGIDNLEHGFFVATDFVPNKKPDVCPGQNTGMAALAKLDTSSGEFQALVADLISHHVAVTSTLTVFETFTPGRPMPPGLDVLDPILKKRYEQFYARVQSNPHSVFATLFPRERAMEVYFVRAGGLLLAGTDPTGAGGVIPGYADQRQVELLVGSGFTPLEAIKICTLNGATYLGRANEIGSIATGKQADLVVIDGNPAAHIADIRHVEMVFKQGVGYDPAKLIASVKGMVGLF
ncbi:MAG TPA: amidohydrolase family protein [Gemmatimonadaceae bacterium]|nr:amidohydrolase family protein [Gemmatimonadaceae bacterium]